MALEEARWDIPWWRGQERQQSPRREGTCCPAPVSQPLSPSPAICLPALPGGMWLEESVSGVANWDCKGKASRGCAAEMAQSLQLQINKGFARRRARGCCGAAEGLVRRSWTQHPVGQPRLPARAPLVSSTPLHVAVVKAQIRQSTGCPPGPVPAPASVALCQPRASAGISPALATQA